jgi:hypothetical protein
LAKVQFNLNDTLLQRQRGERDSPVTSEPAVATAAEAPSVTPVEPPQTESPPPDPAPRRKGKPAVGFQRPVSVQTSVLLPPSLWDQMARLASGLGGLATPNRVLIDVLEARGPRDLEQAAEDLDRFLSLPVDQTGVGDPWEERNVRLPIELRKRLDELRRRLTAAGLTEATRAHLIAASLVLRGPRSGEEAHAIVAERRTEALRRAVAQAPLLARQLS